MTEKAMKEFIEQNVEDGDMVYFVTVTECGDGRRIGRYSTGFTPHELLGILYETSLNIIAQIRGEDKPTIETYKKCFVREKEAPDA